MQDPTLFSGGSFGHTAAGGFPSRCGKSIYDRISAASCEAVRALALGLSACLLLLPFVVPTPASAATRFAGPTSSQPLALSADGKFLAVANPDNNTVSLFNVKNDANNRFAKVKVGKEPSGVAVLPNGTRAYAANTVSGSVSVIAIDGDDSKVIATIKVGTEPYALALTPNGKKLYVGNTRSATVSVIDTLQNKVIRTIEEVGFEPRGLAVTNDGDGDDTDETLYVTQFISTPAVGKVDGSDDAKRGRVFAVSTATDKVTAPIILDPLADTGFKAQGDALNHIPPGQDFIFPTGAYPNQLNNVAIKGKFAFLPATGDSPNGPVRFDVNTQSLLSVFNRRTNIDVHQTINMHLAVAQQTNPAKLFITQPWAMAFKNSTNEGYVISAASNIIVKVKVDLTSGHPTVQLDPSDTSRVLQIKTGKNPRGIAINPADTRAFVMNYVSRDITVIDLTTVPETVKATLKSENLPTPGTNADKIHIGKELYNTSVGEFDPPAPGQQPIVGRMSKAGWGSCGSCHTPFGLSDNVVWIFGSGPRRTISQHTDFDPSDPQRLAMRPLNWSAERDEEEDFELNIRNVSGGDGLIVLSDGITPDPDVANFLPKANGNRNQVKVRGVGAWDAIKEFERFGIRAPISPIDKNEQQVIIGRDLFVAANCQQCHGGPQWTNAKVRFSPPPDPSLIVNGEIISELTTVGTFDPTFFNEVRDKVNGDPLGADGFVPPSLLSIFAYPKTLFHNGAADSLTLVMDNVAHRSAGTGGVDTLSNASDRAKLIRFLKSIDAKTVPIQ
jgi:YVTN family beta-propeller protein